MSTMLLKFPSLNPSCPPTSVELSILLYLFILYSLFIYLFIGNLFILLFFFRCIKGVHALTYVT